MKTGLYPKLALDGIRKNKRLYFPYILTCAGMIMMYYIIVFLQYTDALSYLTGEMTIREVLNFGSWIIAIFSAIFLFYTNSFIMRRRKKEFGLYNILGMGKQNIGKILFWESIFIALISLVAGFIGGFAFSKLAELGLVNAVQGEINYVLQFSPESAIMTLSVFGVIFLLLFLNALRQVKFSSSMQLLRSENIGEKPPKANWFFGILGAALLAVAYYLAVTIKNPMSAFSLFFIAVILVIAGTYLLFVSGSVLFCRILQKKKSYYYKANHFVSVSSMVYRMKRNGAGLASICILATMVLVMISSTASLYFGAEDSLYRRYPKEINIEIRSEDLCDKKITVFRNEINKSCAELGANVENIADFFTASLTGKITGSTIESDVEKAGFDMSAIENLCQIYFVTLKDYNFSTGKNEILSKDEALIYTYRIDYNENSITVNGGKTFKIKDHIDNLPGSESAMIDIIPSIYIVVPDFSTGLEGISELTDFSGNKMINYKWVYDFDTQLENEKHEELTSTIAENLNELHRNEKSSMSFSCDSRDANRKGFYSLYGSLFLLGIVLSVVFIFAAVLIIYYKQISEGYEDQARFEIMQKIGMTNKEIRKSINSQLLTVFFMPITFAGIHLAFAFPMIRKILYMFNLNNILLFAAANLICFIIFALFYTLVYRITSNAYYNIVSKAKEEK